MALTKIGERYDFTDEMPREKYEKLKFYANAGDSPRFLREDWLCEKHGPFYQVGVVGRPFPKAECADCKREKKIIEDSEEAIAKSFLPYSGLFKDQQSLMLDQFSGEKAILAKEFLNKKENLFLLINDARRNDSLLACAMVGYVCRGGRQGQLVNMLQLTYRIQASWKGRKTTEDLLNEMIAYPFLVIEDLEPGYEDWLKKFLIGLLSARGALKRKTVLIAENDVMASIPGKAFAKVKNESVVELTNKLKLNFSPTLEQLGEKQGTEDDNDGIPL